ncbi:MAG: aldo/keto reductase [Erysipelotrichaceae bacterium]|nr:aldo/keto reductase [Erysipelotrichaceae bacterium]
MEYLTLNNGNKIPKLGFGTFLIKGQECEDAVLNAIQTGYRLIDTAEAYGNEKEVGNAIIKSGVPREELYIVTKLNFKNYEKEDAIRTLEQSLTNLQTDYINLVLLHWPFANYYEAYRVLEDFYNQGKIKAIGVSNFNADRLIDLIHYNKIVPAANQVETNVLNQQLEANEWMKKNNVIHMGYAPFGQNKINEIFENKILKEIEGKYNKSTRQVVLRYFTQKDMIMIPKTVHINRMKENINIFDFNLNENEVREIEKLNMNKPVVGNPADPNLIESSFKW